jgi:selenocysteine-specific elongation factor
VRKRPAPESTPKPSAAAIPKQDPQPLDTAALALEARLRDAGHEPPLDTELDQFALARLREAGRVLRAGQSMHFHADAVAEVEQRVRTIIETEGSITLARLRDELGTSRKFAQALLQHLDAARVTLRRPDDSRVLRGPDTRNE